MRLKKIIVFILSIIIVMSNIQIAKENTKADINSIKFGDINGDGNIDLSDNSKLYGYVCGNLNLTEEEKVLADVDGNNRVDENDVQYLYDYVNDLMFGDGTYVLPIYNKLLDAGDCGTSTKYYINKYGQMIVFGEGSIDDYDFPHQPWFKHKDKITSVEIKKGIKTIGEYAFAGMSIESVSIPEGVETIGADAFNTCILLTEINLPSSVKTIGAHALWNNDKLERISVSAQNKYYSSESGILYNKDKTTIFLYPTAKSATSFLLPDTVQTIGERAFTSTNLESITLGNNLKTIEDRGFFWNVKIQEMIIPKSVTSIGYLGIQTRDLEKIVIMNEQCILDEDIGISKPTVVYGYEKSTSETYAEANDLEFVSIDEGGFGTIIDGETIAPITEAPIKKASIKKQYISTSRINKVFYKSNISLNAKTSGNGKLTFKSNNPNVASVSSNGVVTTNGCGTVTITILASKTASYYSAIKNLTFKVIPKKIKSVKMSSPKKNILKISWKKDKNVTGYVVQLCKSKKFKNTVMQKTFGKNKKKVIIKFARQSRKKYYARVRMYKNTDGINCYGAWSKVLSKRVK